VRHRLLAAIAILLVASVNAATQTTVRRATTVAALYQFPSYFHLQNVLLHGEIAESNARFMLRSGEREIPLILNEAKGSGSLVEVRGQLFDVGRLEPGDPRVRAYAGAPDAEHWPRPGEELVVNVTSITDAQLATSPSVRTLALQPWRFEGQTVTIVGEFRGRNLFGDQPSAPGKSRYDFVLRSADAALWVTDLRPRGRGFDLSVEARVDTGRWLQVSGTVSQERGLVGIAGTSVTTAMPQEPAVEDEAPAPAPPPEPGEVVFSSPTDGEVGVPLAGTVRVQFSRGIDPASLKDRIRVNYVGGNAQQGANPQPSLEISSSYDAATRAIEIRFTRPPEPFRTITVDLLDGIRTFDGAPVRPWMLTFSVGG
jgi:Big-like domain-containing protein